MNSEKEKPWRPEPKVVGGTEEEKRRAVESLMKLFRSPAEAMGEIDAEAAAQLKRFEIPKTPEDEQAIEFAEKKSNELAVMYDGKPFVHPPESFYILPPDIYKSLKGDEGAAFYHAPLQLFVFNEKFLKTNRLLAQEIFIEELIHSKGFLGLEATNLSSFGFSPRRSGLMTLGTVKDFESGKMKKFFSGLEEAVVSEFVRRSLPDALNDPRFAAEKEWLASSEFLKKRSALAVKNRIPEEEIYWADKDGNEFFRFGWPYHLQVLNYLIQEVAVDNPGMDKEEAFGLFARARFSGELGPMTKAVRKSFGKGALRWLAIMGEEDSSAINALENLKILRKNVIKSRK